MSAPAPPALAAAARGPEVADLRRRLGLGAVGLARYLGVSALTVANWEGAMARTPPAVLLLLRSMVVKAEDVDAMRAAARPPRRPTRGGPPRNLPTSPSHHPGMHGMRP